MNFTDDQFLRELLARAVILLHDINATLTLNLSDNTLRSLNNLRLIASVVEPTQSQIKSIDARLTSLESSIGTVRSDIKDILWWVSWVGFLVFLRFCCSPGRNAERAYEYVKRRQRRQTDD